MKYSIFPKATDGCQTWKLTENQKKMIQVCQRKMEWKVLGISLCDRIPNAKIRALANTTDIVQRATTLKWKWRGHLAGLHSSRWAQLATMWDPRIGQRRRGRPATRWAGEFKMIAGVHWSTTARSREDWKKNCQNNSIEYLVQRHLVMIINIYISSRSNIMWTSSTHDDTLSSPF